MGLKEFLIPDWRKIVIFVILLYFAPFTYLVPDPVLCSLMGECKIVWTVGIIIGFPILLLFIMNYFPRVIIKGTFYDFELFSFENTINYFLLIIHLIYVYLLSCFIVWVYDKYKKKLVF
jgi:hypothetical protein